MGTGKTSLAASIPTGRSRWAWGRETASPGPFFFPEVDPDRIQMYTIRRGRPMDHTQCLSPTFTAVQTLRQQIAGSRRSAAARTIRRSPAAAAAGRNPPRAGGSHAARSSSGWPTAEGTGATTLAVLAAREACRQGGRWSWWTAAGSSIRRPPCGWGSRSERLLVIHVDNRADHDWALDQALRCPAVAAVMAWPDALGADSTGAPSAGCNWRPRRAEAWACSCGRPGAAGALLGRRAAAGRAAAGGRGRKPRGGDCGCVLLRCRGGGEGRGVEMEFDDETHPLLMAAPLGPGGNPQPRETGAVDLESLAAWCQRFSPLVGIEEGDEPASLLLDITGLAHLFGGEAALAEQMVGDFAARGLRVRLAIADTLGAAWAIAHFKDEGDGGGPFRRSFILYPSSFILDTRRLGAAADRSLAAAGGDRRAAALVGHPADRPIGAAASPGVCVAFRAAAGRAMGPGDGKACPSRCRPMARRRDLPPTGRPSIPRPAARRSRRPWSG